MLSIVLISASLFVRRVFADCSTPPIYLDIRARQVEGTSAPSYGAYINVGTPVQTLSLWPSVGLNETILANIGFCSSSSPSCSASSAHGLFDSSKSSSWHTSTAQSSLDNPSVLTENASSIAEAGTDVFHLWEQFVTNGALTETNISSPLQLLSNYTSTKDPFFGPAGLVGLGSSSTVLSSLVKAGNIASRSYGLFLGSGYPRNGGANGINGSLTLGGYDASRLQAPVQSFPLADDGSSLGSLKVHVSQLTITNTSSPALPLLGASDDFDAYISTSQYEVILPSSLAGQLSSALQTTGGSNSTLGMPSFSSSSNLTFDFGNNRIISIPSDPWLTTSPITFSATGPYILGSSFLSSVYLAVSYDSTPPSFYLAPAMQNATYITPKPLCLNTPPSPQTTTHISFFVKNGLIGLIIGATIGGSAVLLLSCVLFRSWRMRVERKRVVRFVNLKRQEAGEEVELGSVSMNVLKMKASQVHVVEKIERDADRTVESTAQDEEAMYFAPPPSRATAVVHKRERERKMGLKGILKVRAPGQ